jgi:hypothetical protein
MSARARAEYLGFLFLCTIDSAFRRLISVFFPSRGIFALIARCRDNSLADRWYPDICVSLSIGMRTRLRERLRDRPLRDWLRDLRLFDMRIFSERKCSRVRITVAATSQRAIACIGWWSHALVGDRLQSQ